MAEYIINADVKKSVINKNIYGNFSEHLGRCVYEGMFVGKNSSIPNVNGMRTDVVNALREMRLPVLRWPGGCFADTYHWMDGIGKQSERKNIVNIHWGGTTEDNSFGTHEFFEFCRQVGCEPYVCGNLGSGTVREMQEWVDYINNDGVSPMSDLRRKNGQEKAWTVKYWGVGNENWGCGGNMRPEYYADEYRRYATYLYNYGNKPLYKIACGANGGDTNWTEVLMKNAAFMMDGLSLHHYCAWGKATDYDEVTWHDNLKGALRMDEHITRHSTIMDKYDPQKRVGLIVDEWGAWYQVEEGTNPGFLYQQNSIKDAIIAAVSLNIFNKHSDRVRMANIAQLANVLQSVVLTKGEKMVKTPTFYTFKLFASHQDATLVDSVIEQGQSECKGDILPKLSESASIDADGTVTATLVNIDPHADETVNCSLRGMAFSSVTAEIIAADSFTAFNDFDAPEAVNIKPFTNIKKTVAGFTLTIPARSVVKVVIK